MVFKNKVILVFVLIAIVNISCGCKQEEIPTGGDPVVCKSISKKINGVSFVGSVNQIPDSAMDPVVRVNANWITLMPFAFTSNGSPNLQYNATGQWYGEKLAGVADNIRQAKDRGLKIMIKPQMWLFGGTYTGDYNLSSESDWQTFEQKYTSYILEFAEMGDSLDVEMICIGTELKTFIAKRPSYWVSLIDTVSKVFDGELTYAGNWDSYKNAQFWSKLDYIGVDAYFPLSSKKTPSPEDLLEGWKPHLVELEAQSKQYGKPILFTEYGYRSIDYCADKPWESGSSSQYNMDGQFNSYAAVFESCWKKQWFAGGFLWKWHDNHANAGGINGTRFTPQNKPAESMIKGWFKTN